jgi:ABC-2 type transport system permease protein
MSRLIRAELLKLRTTRTAVALIGSALGLVVLFSVVATLASDPHSSDFNAGDLLGIAGFAQIAAFVLGLLAVTTEFRHGTVTPTLIAQPSRVKMVVAKLVANTIAGVVLSGLAVGLCTAIVLLGLQARDVPSGLDSGDVVALVIGQTLAGGLWAAIGVGWGAIVRNQVGAIVSGLMWIFLVENLGGLIPTVGDWIQKYGLNGVSNAVGAVPSQGDASNMLDQLPAALLMLGYAVVFVVAGALVLRDRDVTS